MTSRLWAVGLTVFGVVLISVGLLFLLGADGRGHVYTAAVVGLALGGALCGLGVRGFRAADAVSPEQLRAEILAVAEKQDGEVSEAELDAALGTRAMAGGAVLDALLREGTCRVERKDGGRYFIFAELQPRLSVRRCEYCKAELPLSGDLTLCPACGGTIKTQVERRSLSAGEYYDMDD